jgi:hypothetical protein
MDENLKNRIHSISLALNRLSMINQMSYDKEYNDICSLMKEYMEKNPHDAIFHGTKENTTSGLPEKINNVTDAYVELERLVMDPRTQYINDNTYEHLTKIGDLHVYDNGRPMKYIPT